MTERVSSPSELPLVSSSGPSELAAHGSRSFWGDALRRLIRHNPLGFWGGAVILAVVVLASVFAPIIQPSAPDYQDVRVVEAKPSLSHPFGADHIGRDVFSRVVNGGRISLTVGILSVTLGIAIATILGLVSGYFGGVVDLIVQRIVDVMMAFPGLILILLTVALFGSNMRNVILAIAIFIIAGPSRLIRAQVLSLKNQQFVEASQSVGAGHLRIMLQHILPNMAHIIIVMISINIGGAIILEASLSFLGLGVPPPAPTWGNMIAGPGSFYIRSAPWMVLFPGLVLSLTVYACNMLGDALRDVLDPRLRS
jgi:peptide/nickel transport system permease protein